jgi:hypothetical protein
VHADDPGWMHVNCIKAAALGAAKKGSNKPKEGTSQLKSKM